MRYFAEAAESTDSQIRALVPGSLGDSFTIRGGYIAGIFVVGTLISGNVQSRLPVTHNVGEDIRRYVPNVIPNVMSALIDEIRSYRYLEEDEDFMPVPQIAIDNAISIIQKVFAKDDEMPYWVVPTRSAGIALDYRIGGRQVYYLIEANGSMKVTVLQGYDVLRKRSFSTVGEVATPDDLI